MVSLWMILCGKRFWICKREKNIYWSRLFNQNEVAVKGNRLWLGEGTPISAGVYLIESRTIQHQYIPIHNAVQSTIDISHAAHSLKIWWSFSVDTRTEILVPSLLHQYKYNISILTSIRTYNTYTVPHRVCGYLSMASWEMQVDAGQAENVVTFSFPVILISI